MIRFPAGYDSLNRIKRYQDYYQASYGVMLLSAGQFSPLSLFAAGEQGAWYDPSDFSTMFQDAAGTTPVTAVEQPVGLLLDKSKGLALGNELMPATDASDWAPTGLNTVTDDVDGSVLVTFVDSQFGASLVLSTLIPELLNISKVFKITYEAKVNTGSALVRVLNFVGNTTNGPTITATTYVTHTFIGSWDGSGGISLSFNNLGAGEAINIRNISVRELPGNHASQSTAASRPVLSARVNLLTYSEQFDNAVWVKASVNLTPDAVTAPNGTLTADRYQSTASASVLYQIVSGIVPGVNYTFSFYARNNGGNYASYRVFDGVGSTDIVPPTSYLSSLNETTFTQVSVSFTAPAGCTSIRVYINSKTSSISSDFYVWGADLRVTNVGVNLPAYQRVGAATDYDTSGFPLALKFDGVDDSLATGTIDPGAVDKAQVFAGVRKLSDAAVGIIAELSATMLTNAGSFYFTAPENVGASGNFAFKSRGSVFPVTGAADSGTRLAPVTAVVSGLGDISGDLATIRYNGTATTFSSDQGTGNYLSYPLYIGRRNNATLPLNANLYSLIVRFSAANLSDAQIASTETYVNNLTKAY